MGNLVVLFDLKHNGNEFVVNVGVKLFLIVRHFELIKKAEVSN